MDVGIFKASKMRLVIWIIVPPLLVIIVGLSSYALQQRAMWQLKETRALSNVLPAVITARKNVQQLLDNLGLSRNNRITTGDQLISLLQEEAKKRNINWKKGQILERDKTQKPKVPTISVLVEATGEFSDFQRFLNDVKSAHPLISTRSISLTQGKEDEAGKGFELKVVFDLLLVGDVLKEDGGSL